MLAGGIVASLAGTLAPLDFRTKFVRFIHPRPLVPSHFYNRYLNSSGLLCLLLYLFVVMVLRREHLNIRFRMRFQCHVF